MKFPHEVEVILTKTKDNLKGAIINSLNADGEIDEDEVYLYNICKNIEGVHMIYNLAELNDLLSDVNVVTEGCFYCNDDEIYEW